MMLKSVLQVINTITKIHLSLIHLSIFRKVLDFYLSSVYFYYISDDILRVTPMLPRKAKDSIMFTLQYKFTLQLIKTIMFYASHFHINYN